MARRFDDGRDAASRGGRGQQRFGGKGMKVKLVALAGLVAVGVGALAATFGWPGAKAADGTQYLTAEAAVGDVTEDVAATGSLAASESYGLLFGADSYLVGLS